MKTEIGDEWCSGARTGNAPVHQSYESKLRALAANALRGSGTTPGTIDAGASGAPGASGALGDFKSRLLVLADRMGIPRAVVDGLPAEDLAATAQQAQACEGHLDRDGNPLARSLLMFYLQTLAGLNTGF